MKKLLYILILVLTPALVEGQTSYSFKKIKGLEDGYITFNHGNKVAVGSEAVAERLAHEVFVGTGKPKIKAMGPHPKFENPYQGNPEVESWNLKQIGGSKNLFAIEHNKTKLVFTAKLNGEIALEPYKKGNKRQHFILDSDTAKYSHTVFLKSAENGLVTTIGNGPLKLTPRKPGDRNQLWFAYEERFFDLIYELNGPHWFVAYGAGKGMAALSKHEKAQKYFEEAYRLNPDNYALLEELGDRYMKYDIEKAIKFYDEAFTHNNADAEFCARLGLKAVKAHLPNGLRYIRKANELKPHSVNFEELAWFHNEMAPVKYKDKYGVINLKGELLTKEWYDDVYQDFENTMIPVKKDGKWRNINNRGEFVGDWIKGGGSFKNGIARIQSTEDKWGVIDTVGQSVLPCEYKKVNIINDMIVVQNDQDQYKVFSKTGKPLTSEWYADGYVNELNIMVALKKNGKWRYLNSNGEFLDVEFNQMTPFTKGVAFIQNFNEKWGAIDSLGNLVLPYQYDGVMGVCNGMAAIENKKGEYAVINLQGKMLSDGWYEDAWVAHGNSMIALNKRKKWFYVNETDDKVFKNCQSISVFSEGYAFVKRWGKWGVINEEGKKTADFDYDSFKSSFENGRALVEQDEKTFYINPFGEKLKKKLLEY
ncbi:MAG TPA: WG repeat-containing protein [Bacteroidales bacterium]|nr:WG repeat-containing protein [Bacteroidales bacterium]